MKTTLDNRKQRLEEMKKSPGRDTRNYTYWYDMLRGMPYREKVTIELADLTALVGATDQIKVLDLPPGAELLSIFVNTVTPLAGPGPLTAATISVGQGAPYTSLLLAGNCFAAGISKVISTDLTTDRAVYDMAATTDIEAEIILTGSTFPVLTAGEIEIHYTYIEHN